MSSDSLAQKERQLQLIMALDDIRDNLDDDGDPSVMFDQIVSQLRTHFDADACAVALINENTDEVETIATVGIPDDMALTLCRESMAYRQPQALQSTVWQFTRGFQILMEENKTPLGGIFIARKSHDFDAEESQLLEIAESQIDSAIIQARTIWKLAQRNRELEAIYRIDHLTDNASGEISLINSFTGLLLDYFKAELAMLMLTQIDSGELIVRGMIDKSDLSAQTLEAIRELAFDLQSPQVLPSPPNIRNLNLLAAPFIVSGVRLGAVVVGRRTFFRIADNRLMYAMISQMDSAMVKNRIEQQLRLRNQELEAIYAIDHIRDQEIEFDQMMQLVLEKLCSAISSETGYIMLYNAEEEQPLELKAMTEEADLTKPEYLSIITKVSRQALDGEEIALLNNQQGAVRSIIATPLILNDQIIGVFGAINSTNSRGFNAEDRRMLSAVTSQVDTAVFERLERRRMRQVLSRSVDPKVLEALLQRADDSVLAGERVVISVLFADLRGSTEWTERTDPEELVMLLNEFLARMTDVIFRHNGTLDKFVGDEVIALFGSPIHMEDHALRAAEAALEMQRVHEQLREELAAQGKELPQMGVGVSSGEVIAGEFGPPIRTDFTAMGRVMNLGSRLCGAATGRQVIISAATREMLGVTAQVNELTPITLKGITNPVQTYELLQIDESASSK